MNEESLEYGRQEMGKLLSQLGLADCPGFNKPKYAFIVPRTHPALIAKGSNSLVFGLPPRKVEGVTEYLVGKGFKYTDITNFQGVPEDEFHLVACNSGLTIDGYGLDTTLYWLKKMGLEVEIPLMKEYHANFSGKRTHFTIMPDLREGRKYQVDEAENLIFRELKNGKDLKLQKRALCEIIEQQVKKQGLEVVTAGHGSEEKILPALEHMFLVQSNRNMGKLVIGDLNHLAIHEKGRQYGIKPAYLD